MHMSHRRVFVVLISVAAGCGSKDKLVDEGGMPKQLDKVRCGASAEDVIRAYPDIEKSNNQLVRTVGHERFVVTLKDGKVASGVVFDFSADAPKSFGTLMQKLEGQFGKGTLHDTREKTIYWEPKSGPIERVLLIGDGKSTSLATSCIENAVCDTHVAEYKRVLVEGSQGVAKLTAAGCASERNRELVPIEPVTVACKALWMSHFATVDRVITAHDKAARACPEARVPAQTVTRPSPSLVAAISTSPTRSAPSSTATPATLAGDPWSSRPAPTGTVPAQLPTALTGSEVHALLKSQVDALRTGDGFAEAFADDAVVFFPYSLDLHEGKERVEEGYRASWPTRRTPTRVSSDDVNVGLDVDIAWATTTWTLVYSDDARERVRVTEVISRAAGKAKVVAASFSVAARGGAPASPPAIPVISTASSEGDVVAPKLLHPLELAKSVRNDPGVHAFGSDVGEDITGPDGVRKLLGGWKSVKLQYAGNPRIIERGTAKIIVAYARWRGGVLRVLGLFSPGEEMVNMAPWEMLAVDYSVVSK